MRKGFTGCSSHGLVVIGLAELFEEGCRGDADAAAAGASPPRSASATSARPPGSVAIDRDVNAFSADQQPQIRGLLAESLSGISAQQLVRRADGHGRIAVHEILFSS